MPTERRRDAGWTLTELMVVLLVSGVLAAVAIPTFLGSRRQAADQAAGDRLDAAASVLGEVWAEYHTFCVPAPAATTTTTQAGGCQDASLTTVMNGLEPGTVADQAGDETSGVTPPAPPTVLVRSATEVEMGALTTGRRCVYLAYLEAPSSVSYLGAGVWYATGPALAQGGQVCWLAATPVPGWHRSWGQAGA